MSLPSSLHPLVVALALVAPPFACASPGTPDPSFGVEGVVSTELPYVGFPPTASWWFDVESLPDGKIVAAGLGGTISEPYGAVVRMTLDGGLDPTFATNGLLRLPPAMQQPRVLVTLSDGRILVASDRPGASGFPDSVVLARILEDGTSDATFAAGGVWQYTDAALRPTVIDMELDSAGRIVLAIGTFGGNFPGTSNDFALIRLLENGTPDASFGSDGRVHIATSDSEWLTGFELISGGGIIAVGRRAGAQPKLALFRFLENGESDGSFGTNGTVELPAPDGLSATDVAVDASQRVLVSARADSPNGFIAMRFMPDGTFDTGFGEEGIVNLEVGSVDSKSNRIMSLPNDKVLLGGSSDFGKTPYGFNLSVVRLRDGGQLDDTFGDQGTFTSFTQNDEYDRSLQALALDNNLNLLLGGARDVISGRKGLLIRLVGGDPAVVTEIAAPGAGTVHPIGTTIEYSLAFDQAVDVDTLGGSPFLSLQSNGGMRSARFLSGSGSDTLRFGYTVQEGDGEGDFVLSPEAIVLDGGAVTSVDGSPVHLDFSSIASVPVVSFDGTRPRIESVDLPAADNYLPGQSLDFDIEWSEPIETVGTPRVELEVGGEIRYAELLTAIAPDLLRFRYTVQTGDEDSDGIGMGQAIDLNDGAIRDLAGNDAVVELVAEADAVQIVIGLPIHLRSATNPSLAEVPLALVATVAGDAPTGTISFLIDGSPIQGCEAVPLNTSIWPRKATCDRKLPAGQWELVAQYGGDGSNPAGSSPVILQRIHYPPQFGLPLSVTMLEDSETVMFSFQVFDEETSPEDLVVSASLDAGSEIAFDPAQIASGLGGSGTDRTLMLTPKPDFHGQAGVRLRVEDHLGGATESLAFVRVQPVNDAPFLYLGPTAYWPEGTTGPRLDSSAHSAWPGPWEAESVSVEIVGVEDPSGILTAGPMVMGHDLHYSLSGSSGAARVRFVAVDDGGTENGGVDRSEAQERFIVVGSDPLLRVTVLPPVGAPLASLPPAEVDGVEHEFRVQVHNVGLTGTWIQLRLESRSGLFEPFWYCGVGALNCSPDMGLGSTAQVGAYTPGTGVSTIQWGGGVIAADRFVEIHAEAFVQPPLLPFETAWQRAVLVEAVSPVAVYRSGFE